MKKLMMAMAMGAFLLSGSAMAKPPAHAKAKKSMATPNLAKAERALKQAAGACKAAQTAHKDHGGLGGHAAKCQELVEQAMKEVEAAKDIAKGGGAAKPAEGSAEGAKEEAKPAEGAGSGSGS